MPQHVVSGNRKSSNLPIWEGTSTSGALALTIDPSCEFELLRLEFHLEAAITASEALTATCDAGDGALYDTVAYSATLTGSAAVDYVKEFGANYVYEADDKIVISCPNSLAKRIGVRIAYKEF